MVIFWKSNSHDLPPSNGKALIFELDGKIHSRTRDMWVEGISTFTFRRIMPIFNNTDDERYLRSNYD